MKFSLTIDMQDFKPSSMKRFGNMVVEKKKGTIDDQMIEPSGSSHRDYLVHEVKKGEDWWDIAEQYDCDGTELQNFNSRFTPNSTLYEGREIKIPRHFVKRLSDTNLKKEY